MFDTIESVFDVSKTNIDSQIIQPFSDAKTIIELYNESIKDNTLTQEHWKDILSLCDDSTASYLTNIKGTTASFNGYTVSLNGSISGFKKVSHAIKRYNSLNSASTEEQQAFIKAISLSNPKLASYLTNLNGANAGLKSYGVSLVASKIKTIGLTVATTALNAAVTMGISLIVSGLISAISSLFHSSDELISNMEEARQKIDEAQDSLKNISTTISENKERFLELSQGVDKFSKNISLSKEDYEEYLEISSKFAEIAPELVNGYDEQGNALLKIGENASETSKKLQEVIDKQKAATEQTALDNFATISTGISNEVSDIQSSIEETKQELEKAKKQYSALTSNFVEEIDEKGYIYVDEENKKYLELIEKAFDEVGAETKKNGNYIQITSASVQQIQNAQNIYDSLVKIEREYSKASINNLEQTLQTKENDIQNSYSKINQSLQAWLNQNDRYNFLPDNYTKLIDKLVPTIDWNSLETPPINPEDYYNYITENLINPLYKIPQEDKIKVDELIGKVLSFDDGDLNIIPIAEQIKALFYKNGIEIDLTPIIGNEEEFKKKLDISIKSIATKNNTTIASAKEETLLRSFTKDFTSEQIEVWTKVNLGVTSATEAIRNFKNAWAEVNNVPISFTDSISKVQALSEGLDQLDKIYADIYNQEDFDWSSILNNESFKTAFESCGKSYDNFIKIVANSPTDINACQAAFNSLVSDYVVQSGILDNLTEENKSVFTNILKGMGVSNANEVLSQHLKVINEVTSAGYDLNDMTEAQAVAFIHEAEASDVAKQYIQNYALKKAIASNPLQTSSDLKNLEDLCNGLGVTNELLTYTIRLKDSLAAVEAGVPLEAEKNFIEEYRKKIEELSENPVSVGINFEFTGGSATNSVKEQIKKDSKDSKDAWKEAFNEELETLKHQLAMNQITEAQYYNSLNRLNQKYFANKKEYLSEYRQYEEEVYKGLRSLQDNALSSIHSLIDLRKEMIKDMKQDEIDAINKVIEKEKKKLEAINESIDARKKAIELLKDERTHDEEMADKNKVISDIQSKIDALKYDNSASAQKKRRELEEELTDAKKELADYITDYEYDKAVDALDKESDAAQKKYDKEEERLQNQIDKIEEYINNQKLLTQDALNDINGLNQSLFEKMKQWALDTKGEVYDVVDAWYEARKALELYNGVNRVPQVHDTLHKNAASQNGVTPIGNLGSKNTNKNNSNTSSGNSNNNSNSGYKAVHTIVKNDTLWVLAQKYYGDGTKWTKIQQANGNINPNNLPIGKKLYIPYKKGTKKVPENQLALTDELGEELILHANEKGTLRNLTKGSSVIPADITENLMSWGNFNPDMFIKNLTPTLPNITSVSNSKANTPAINIGDININGNMGNLTKSDLNNFRKEIVNDVYDNIQKNRVKNGRY